MTLIILYTITAHFFVDFYLQSDALVKRKHNEIKAHFWHAFTHLLALLPLLLYDANILLGFAVIAVAFIHFIIDLIKSQVKVSSEKSVLVFIIDQLLHITTIYIIMYSMIHHFPPYNHEIERVIITTLIIVVLFKPIDLLIEIIFVAISPKKEEISEEDFSKPSSSRLIGYIERVLFTILIIMSMNSLVPLFIGVKTAGRWHEVQNNKTFGLQYYIGTFISVLAAILAGTLISKMY